MKSSNGFSGRAESALKAAVLTDSWLGQVHGCRRVQACLRRAAVCGSPGGNTLQVRVVTGYFSPFKHSDCLMCVSDTEWSEKVFQGGGKGGSRPAEHWYRSLIRGVHTELTAQLCLSSSSVQRKEENVWMTRPAQTGRDVSRVMTFHNALSACYHRRDFYEFIIKGWVNVTAAHNGEGRGVQKC